MTEREDKMKKMCFLAIFAVLGWQSVMATEENQEPVENPEVKPATRQVKMTPYRVGAYHGIDDWTDTPVLEYSIWKMEDKPRLDVTLWSDGRVAWMDNEKTYGHYFKAQIPEEDMGRLLEKITAKYHDSILERYWTKTHDYRREFHFHTLCNQVGNMKLRTPGIIACQYWMGDFPEKARELRGQKKNMPRDEWIDSLRKEAEADKHSILNSIFAIYSEIYGKNEPDTPTYSDREIYYYTRLFIEDGDLYFYIGDLLREILPSEEGLESAPVEETGMYFVTKAHTEGDQTTYTYRSFERKEEEKPPASGVVSYSAPVRQVYYRPARRAMRRR